MRLAPRAVRSPRCGTSPARHRANRRTGAAIAVAASEGGGSRSNWPFASVEASSFVITITSIPERKATKYFTELEGDRSRERWKMAQVSRPHKEQAESGCPSSPVRARCEFGPESANCEAIGPEGYNRSARTHRICARFRARQRVSSRRRAHLHLRGRSKIRRSHSGHVSAELLDLQTWHCGEPPVVRQERLAFGADRGHELQGVRRLDAGARAQLGGGP